MSDVFKRHREKIARDTLRMSDEMVGVMGGMTKAEARDVLGDEEFCERCGAERMADQHGPASDWCYCDTPGTAAAEGVGNPAD